MIAGRIVKNISDLYVVESNNNLYECKAKGVFRNKNITPLVGDFVKIDSDKNLIIEILDRKNSLERPPLANIDQVIIVTSLVKPDFSDNLLDKMLAMLEYNKIKPIICFTKLDLLKNKSEYKKISKYYKSLGYIVLTNQNLFKLKRLFKNKLTVLTGQSGAGKSTLMNKLDKNLNLKTDEISHSLNRGKHTTRHTELFGLYKGKVADTPGFSAFDLNSIERNKLKELFIEFNKFKCKYKDCNHINEEGCLIINNKNILKSRYNNYKKFYEGK